MLAFNFVVEYMTKATDAITAWFHYAVEKVTTDPLWGGAVLVFILAVVVFLVLKKKAAG
jgi:hypothetical protein